MPCGNILTSDNKIVYVHDKINQKNDCTKSFYLSANSSAISLFTPRKSNL